MVFAILRQQILEGHFQSNGPIPSEKSLSEAFGVSRITIRHAMKRLQSEGLIFRERGRGTFVTETRLLPEIQTNFRGIFENLVAMGLRTKVRVIEIGYVDARLNVAEVLGVQSGDKVQRAVRVRYHKNTPFSHLTTYLPQDLGRYCSEEKLAEQPLLLLLERSGVKVSSADQVISAKLADPIVAPLLHIETGSPLIWVKRLVRDQNSRPVEYLHALYRPDIYEYEMRMSRMEGEAINLWNPVRG